MAEILIICDSDDDDDDVQVITSSSQIRIGARSNFENARVPSDKDVCCLSASISSNDCPSSRMDSPVRKKARTRRGIACQRKAVDSELMLNDNMPIYTSQILVLREKLLAADHNSLTVELQCQDESENICPTDNSQGRILRDHRKRNEVAAKKPPTLSLVGSDDDDDDALPPPPPPPIARRGRKTKKQLQQEALLRNLQNAQEKFKASKLLEKQTSFSEFSYSDLDVSIVEDDLSKEIQMKFRWRSQISRIPMKMNQRFYGVFPELAELCGVPSKDLLLSVRDITIKPENTPSSLGLSVVDIIDCGVTTPLTSAEDAPSTNEAQEDDENCIRLRLQSHDQRSKVTVTVRKTELLCSIMEQYAEKQGVPLEKLTFKFDGETIGPEDTPEDLDLEDDFCIDVIIQS